MTSHYREITVMATDITPTGGCERAAALLEVYGRAANGQFLPRLALANNLLKSVNVGITNIQVNVASPPDLTPVFDALRALPQLLQDKTLQKNYRAVLNHYENYLHHGDELYLKDVLLRCATEVPDFESALEETLKALAPDPYDYRFAPKKLEPLKSLCNSYLGMLAYNFHAVAIYHPDTATDETAIQVKTRHHATVHTGYSLPNRAIAKSTKLRNIGVMRRSWAYRRLGEPVSIAY